MNEVPAEYETGFVDSAAVSPDEVTVPGDTVLAHSLRRIKDEHDHPEPAIARYDAAT